MNLKNSITTIPYLLSKICINNVCTFQEEGVRRETLSSNSSSSESVNSQEGLQVGGRPSGHLSDGATPLSITTGKGGSKKIGPPAPPRTRQDALEQRHQELLRKQKLLQDQYTRLQQLQSSQILQRLAPAAGPTALLNDLKKTGSESNILSKAGIVATGQSGSLTHLAGNAPAINFAAAVPPKPVTAATSVPMANKGPAVPAKPTQMLKNKIYETDIL